MSHTRQLLLQINMPQVEVSIIREAVEEYIKETNSTWSDVCRLLSWKTAHQRYSRQQDISRLYKMLGMMAYNSKGKPGIYKKYMQEKTALKIIEAIGRDPVEFDI